MNKATETQPATNQHGALLIKTTLVEGGVSLYVADAAGRVDELSKSFTDRDQAAAYYRHIAAAAEQGKRMYQIVWEVQALEEAQNAATGRTAEQLAQAINADGDAYVVAEVEVHNALVALKDEIMADADPNWKANLRKQVTAQANQGLARFAQSTTTRAVKLTAAQQDIVTLAARNGGRIVRGGQPGQANSKQIIALHACGLATITYGRQGNTRTIVGAQLTAKGFRYAGVESRSAA